MEISEDMYPSEQEGNPKAKAASESCQTGTETLLSLVVSKCTYTRRVSEEIEEKWSTVCYYCALHRDT